MPIFLFPCYSQVVLILKFIWDYSVKLLFLKCLRPIERKKVIVTILVPKLQNLFLLVTRRYTQLEPCILQKVPFSPLLSGTIWIAILLKSSALQNRILHVNANFVTKSFLAFIFYDNIKTVTMAFNSKLQTLVLTIMSMKSMMRVSKRNCVLVNISRLILNLKRWDTKYSFMQRKTSNQKYWKRSLITFSVTSSAQR